MTELVRIDIDRDVAAVATRRAEELGLTVTAYVSLLLRRSFERAQGEESILTYDHVSEAGEVHIDRDDGEGEDDYNRRSTLYGSLFGQRG